MKEVMKLHTCEPTAPSPALAMHKESPVGSNTKPKVRIIHIFAPEIIKTDVENFRELVQKLTGKPSGGRKGVKRKAKKATSYRIDAPESEYSKTAKETELRNVFRSSRPEERVKEEEIWGDENSSCFGGLGDLDGFIQGLTEFPFNSSHFGSFGEAHVSS